MISTATSSTSGSCEKTRAGTAVKSSAGNGVPRCLTAHDVLVRHKNVDDDDYDDDNDDIDGFLRLSNALHLKDLDQDGYILSEVAREVVSSYSAVYNLGIENRRLEDVLAQTSNGQHVDIQTLLRMLGQKKTR